MMKLPLAYFIIGIVGTVFFFVISFALALLNQDPASWVVFSFSLLSIPLIIAYFQCRIFYDNEKMLVRNFFGRKKMVYYAEIIDVKNDTNTLIETNDGSSVRIPNDLEGRFELLMTLASQLSGKIGNHTRAAAKNPPVRAFRDSVWRSGEIIVAFVLVYAVIIALAVMGLFVSNGAPILWMALVGAIVWTACVFLSIHSAKRAHRSAFWKKIACICFKERYLNE